MTELLLQTPLDDYELVDFGAGRKLERFGRYLVERPEPRAGGSRALPQWQPDWSYVSVAASSQWQPRGADCPAQWQIQVAGRRIGMRIGDGPELGFDPEQLLCWQWLQERVSGCYHIQDLRVLNLFAGCGGATATAYDAGAVVTHVDANADLLERARANLGGDAAIEWVHEDAHGFVDHALRAAQTYHLLLLRPCARIRGPHGRSWDMSCDMTPLFGKLPRLADTQCRGVWFAPRENERGKDWNPETLAGLVREAFPGRGVEGMRLGIATAAGRVLDAGSAAAWADDSAADDSAAAAALDAAAMEERLDVFLDPVLSSRRTAAAPARALAAFDRTQQEFVLRWVEAVARSNAEMAYQYAANVATALERMSQRQVEEWLMEAMDAYDTAGLHAGVAILQRIEEYVEQAGVKQAGMRFDEAVGTLELFVHGLSGRRLKLEAGEPACTDTETVYLPELVSVLPTPQQNFQLYKAQAAYLWAQSRFGTFNADLIGALAAYPDRGHALTQFATLERIRLDACIGRELPGLQRQLAALRETLEETLVPAGWQSWAMRLQAPGAGAETSLALLEQAYGSPGVAPVSYQGMLDPARVQRVRDARLAREKQAFQVMLAHMAEEAGVAKPHPEKPARFALETEETEQGEPELHFSVDGRPAQPPAQARDLISSIIQDFGDIPPEYLFAADSGGYKPDPREPEDRSRDVWKGTYHEEGAFLYNEWDHKRQHYRKSWCVLRESDVSPHSLEFVERALRKHSGLVKNIRRTFEVLRGEEKVLKKQPHGDEIDIDALVEGYGDVCSGMELTDRLFTRKQKVDRNIAVMFMVDMSGSTKGWINDAEREALLLLCEALESLGDRYAIYGFSGMTRKRCELYRVKRFDEPYDATVKGRISGIEPQDYTRMGVTIRHLSKLLNQQDARTRLLITLSDGKPDDFDGYRGEYGIEDTRMALIEAKRDGIHPYCITIDTEAHDYLPHMYGAVNYSVIDEVRKLPLRVSDIYRKLTS